jgi:hypothetical protein
MKCEMGCQPLKQLLQTQNKNNEVTFSLCLTKHYAKSMYGAADAQSHVLLTSALVGGHWSASGPYRFTPAGKDPPVSIV